MATDTKPAPSVNDPIKEFLGSGGNLSFGQAEDNHPVEGVYLGCRVEDDPFTPGKFRMIYDLEVNGEPKELTSGSKRLAKEVLAKNPNPGDFIRITRILGATQYDTTFTVETSPEGVPF